MGVEGTQYQPNELCKVFLNLNPRPNMVELMKALHPIGDYFNHYDSYKHRKDHLIPDPDPDRPHYPDQINLKRGYKEWIPDPKRKGWFIRKRLPFIESEYVKTVLQESILRRKYMKEIIKSRGQKVPKEEPKRQFTWLVSSNVGLFPMKS